jgi:hypothetical protein
MMKQVVGLFDSMRDAESAVRAMQNLGINSADISLVARTTDDPAQATGDYRPGAAERSEAGEGAGFGATGGAVVGGVAGALIGLGTIVVPGIGAVLAAGPFAAAIGSTTAAVGLGALGAGIGAAAGGIIGGLVGAGIPEDDAHVYAEGVRRGGVLVIARVDDSHLNNVMDIFDQHNVVNIDRRGEDLRSSGWSRFDEKAEPLDATSLERPTLDSRAVGDAQNNRDRWRVRTYDYRDTDPARR